MYRFSVFAVALLLSSGCLAAGPSSPTPVESSPSATPTESSPTETSTPSMVCTAQQDYEPVTSISESYPGITDELDIINYTERIEREYAHDVHMSDSWNDSTVGFSNVDVSSEDNETIVTFSEVHLAGSIDGDPADLSYSVTYSYADDALLRNESFPGNPPPAGSGEALISCQ